MNKLYNAICFNQLDTVKSLIQERVDIDGFFYGTPMLYHAIFFGTNYQDNEIVKCLIDAGVNKETTWGSATSPLHYAISQGNHEVAKYLIDKGANIESLWADLTSLHHAIREGNYEIAKHLIDKGANIEALWVGLTPLYHAISEGNNKIIKYLIDKNANKEFIYLIKGPALHHAIDKDNTEIVKYLIDNGANKDLFWGALAPLLFAIFKGNYEMAKYLIDEGANKEALFLGRTALLLALTKLAELDKTPDSFLDIATYLIDRGSLVNAQDPDGNTPIHLVVNLVKKLSVTPISEEKTDLLAKVRNLLRKLMLVTTDYKLTNNKNISVMQAIKSCEASSELFNEVSKERSKLILCAIALRKNYPLELVEKILIKALPDDFPKNKKARMRSVMNFSEIADNIFFDKNYYFDMKAKCEQQDEDKLPVYKRARKK